MPVHASVCARLLVNVTATKGLPWLCSVCAKGTKMLLYDGMFPAPTVVQQEGRQVCVFMHVSKVG